MVATPRGHSAWPRLVSRVLAESDICWLCGRPGADTGDHVVPLSQGGDLLSPANVRPAHKRCNSARGNSPPQSVTVRSRRWR